MPVYSMTGFASRQSNAAQVGIEPTTAAHGTGRLEIEIRSVNSRFLDLSFRLPEDLRTHEPWLRELLKASIRRGKVELRAQVQVIQDPLLRAPSQALLQQLSALQAQVRDWIPEARPLATADILRLATAYPAKNSDLGDDFRSLAEATLKDFMSTRKREGGSLSEVMLGKVEQLRALSHQAKPMIPEMLEQQRQRFLSRWREAMEQAGTGADHSDMSERAIAEVTAFAIRIDVDEELSRLQAHLDELTRLLQRGGEIGKRLEFLIQELHREANTLGSKSASLEMTRIAVDMKVLIEQLREQVQNIE